MNDKIYVYIKKGEDIKNIEELLQKASHTREPYYDLYTDSDRDYIAYNQLKKSYSKRKRTSHYKFDQQYRFQQK